MEEIKDLKQHEKFDKVFENFVRSAKPLDDPAKEEAARVMERAEREIELEKSKVRDEVKQEMIDVAKAMAGRFVAASLDDQTQARLIDEALNEMGEDTWQS